MEDRSSSPSPFFYRRRVQAYIVGRLGYCRAIHWWWILPRAFPPGLGSLARWTRGSPLSLSLSFSLSVPGNKGGNGRHLFFFFDVDRAPRFVCDMVPGYVDAIDTIDPRPVLSLGNRSSMIARFLWLWSWDSDYRSIDSIRFIRVYRRTIESIYSNFIYHQWISICT